MTPKTPNKDRKAFVLRPEGIRLGQDLPIASGDFGWPLKEEQLG